MDYTLKRKIYESIPLSLKNLLNLVPFSMIAGSAYREVSRQRIKIDKASREEIHSYQEMLLGKMLRFATYQVPAYQPHRSVVNRLPPFEALKDFPLLDKETLQKNMHDYLPRDFHKIPHYECTTGGTSGNQLRFFVDDISQSVETAFMHRQWYRVGYTPKYRKATFRGVPFPNLKDDIYWQYNPIYNELQFSPFHLNEKTMGSYVDKLISYNPKFIHGYPSAIDILSEYILRNGLTELFKSIKAILLGSESCLPEQRQRIAKAFNTRPYTWYGHSERVVLAGECEYTPTYHHFPDYGVLEIIAKDGSECIREGDRGEIVGTGLLNHSLPLIRYRSGDTATRCVAFCECGRNWDRFTDVKGRWEQDMVIGRNGTRISLAALNIHGPLFEKVQRYQYVQREIGRCVINVMVAPNFSNDDLVAISNAFADKTGDELTWHVQIVEDIPLTARGKLKLLNSQLDQSL